MKSPPIDGVSWPPNYKYVSKSSESNLSTWFHRAVSLVIIFTDDLANSHFSNVDSDPVVIAVFVISSAEVVMAAMHACQESYEAIWSLIFTLTFNFMLRKDSKVSKFLTVDVLTYLSCNLFHCFSVVWQ